jgi:hypothetical protein
MPRPSKDAAARPDAPAREERRPTAEDARRLMGESQAHVEGFLATFPRNLTEGRQKIVRDLWPDPKPAELQAIFRIAADTAREGPRRDLPRQVLALRYRSRLEMHHYWSLRDLRGERIRTLCDSLRILAAAVVQFHKAAETVLGSEESGGSDDLDYLRQVIPPLLPDRNELASAATLVPILERLSDHLAGGAVDEGSLPPLSPEERALLDRFSPEGGGARDLDRYGLEALALHWQIERDLAAWEASAPGDQEDESLSRRLRIDLATYRALSNRLQRQHDAALAAHQSEVVAELDVYRRSLFASFQRLAPVVRGHRKLGEEAKRGEAARPAAGGSLNREQLETDSVLEAARENAFRNAISGEIAMPEALPEPGPTTRRSRLPWLVATLVALLGILGAVYYFLPQGPPPRIQTTPADYASVLPLSEARSVGTMLHARATESWASLSESQRTARLEELGRLASGRGFDTVHLADPQGRTVAEWTESGGPVLHALPEAPAQP